MTDFKPGERVVVQCEAQPGPFSEERLVTFETVDGYVSGFVQESELSRMGELWYVSGIVRGVEDESIQVWIRGSFFTTNGLASVPQRLALAA